MQKGLCKTGLAFLALSSLLSRASFASESSKLEDPMVQQKLVHEGGNIVGSVYGTIMGEFAAMMGPIGIVADLIICKGTKEAFKKGYYGEKNGN